MEKPTLVTTQDEEINSAIAAGVADLAIVAIVIAGVYVYFDNLTVAAAVGD